MFSSSFYLRARHVTSIAEHRVIRLTKKDEGKKRAEAAADEEANMILYVGEEKKIG